MHTKIERIIFGKMETRMFVVVIPTAYFILIKITRKRMSSHDNKLDT